MSDAGPDHAHADRPPADRAPTDPARLDRAMLDRAGRLALLGLGRVEPNPMVGCVIARNGQILGVGAHRVFGQAHAERRALDDCRRRGHDPAGATAYVTLEPCAHTGNQPPCAEALREANLAEVVYAAADPNPQAAGGAAALRDAGLRARWSDASALAAAVSAPFRRRVSAGLPWVVAKWAQTLDGRIATRSGESRWISNDASRRRVHALRGRVDAILTGMGTVLADDPRLTARGAHPRRRPARVVLDPDLDLPADSQLVRTARETPTIACCNAALATAAIAADARARLGDAGVQILPCPPGPRGLDISATLRLLHERHGIGSVLVEGGAGLLGSLLEADAVDMAIAYVAPLMLGDDLARSVAVGRVAAVLSAGVRLRLSRVRPTGEDVELTYFRRDPRDGAA